jgi:hypothetical protein
MSQKIVISADDLLNLGVDQDPELYVRYRLVSEDRNRVSAWTPIFVVPNP